MLYFLERDLSLTETQVVNHRWKVIILQLGLRKKEQNNKELVEHHAATAEESREERGNYGSIMVHSSKSPEADFLVSALGEGNSGSLNCSPKLENGKNVTMAIFKNFGL